MVRRRWVPVAVGVVGLALAGVVTAQSPVTSTAGGDLKPAERVTVPIRTLTVLATGDVLTENLVLEAGQRAAIGSDARYDFAPLLAPIVPLIEWADLAICHMELPIGAPGERVGVYGRSPYGGNLLLAPWEIAGGLKAVGFDRCSTASNHSYDLGAGGIESTLAALDSAGLSHDGTARTESEAQPHVFTVNGVRVAHLSYTRVSNTDPPAAGWRFRLALDASKAIADVHAARAAGAEIVILSVHLFKEMGRTPQPDEVAFVEEVTSAARVDLIVEHGPHVVQDLGSVNGVPVFWSVGNLLSGMGLPGLGRYSDERTLDGLAATVTFTEVTPGVFHADPAAALLCSERTTRVVYPAFPALEGSALDPDLREQLEACVARTVPVVPGVR